MESKGRKITSGKSVQELPKNKRSLESMLYAAKFRQIQHLHVKELILGCTEAVEYFRAYREELGRRLAEAENSFSSLETAINDVDAEWDRAMEASQPHHQDEALSTSREQLHQSSPPQQPPSPSYATRRQPSLFRLLNNSDMQSSPDALPLSHSPPLFNELLIPAPPNQWIQRQQHEERQPRRPTVLHQRVPDSHYGSPQRQSSDEDFDLSPEFNRLYFN